MPTFHKAFKEVGIVPISIIFYGKSAQENRKAKTNLLIKKISHKMI